MGGEAPSGGEKKLSGAVTAARSLCVQAGVLSLGVNMLVLTGPLYMLLVYDRVLTSRSTETLLVITILAFGLFAAMGILDFARGGLLSRAGEAFEARLKSIAFDFSLDKASRGETGASRQPVNDLRTIRMFMSGPGLGAAFDLPWTPLFLGLIFLMHPLLGVVALIGLAILVVLAFLNERASRAFTASAQADAKSADSLTETGLRNAAVADALGMRDRLRQRWLASADKSVRATLNSSDRIGGYASAAKAARLFLQSAILGTGAWLATKGIVTPGVMIAASIIAARALAPVEVLTSQWRNCALAWQAFERTRIFLSDKEIASPRTSLPAPIGHLAVSNIVCRPGAAHEAVLRRLSFKLEAGEAMGIIGPSAAGKSTLARAIVGVEPVLSGEVRLDGANIAHWSRTALGAHLGYLPQQVDLFDGTVAWNISRCVDKSEDGEVINAAKAAGAHEMILSLPEGYDTQIGAFGAHLSAGQRQRVGLARALYGKPVLVVLDEPNANLDSDGDAALAAAVRTLKARGATTIIVAHRPSAIAFVDKLLVLARGEVQSIGPRDDILKQLAPTTVTSFQGRTSVTSGPRVTVETRP